MRDIKKILFIVCIFGAGCIFCDSSTNMTQESINSKIKDAAKKQENKDYVAAIAEYSEIIKYLNSICYDTKKMADVYSNRGYCLFEIGDFEKAEKDYRIVIPYFDSGGAEYFVGRCLLAKGEPAAACEMFESALMKNEVSENGNNENRYVFKLHLSIALKQSCQNSKAVNVYTELRKEYPYKDYSVYDEFFGWKGESGGRKGGRPLGKGSVP